MTEVSIRSLESGDCPAVERIYRTGIDTGNATFEAHPPTWAEFDAGKRQDLRFVAMADDGIVGWVAAASVSKRDVYSGVVEHSVYVDDRNYGKGIGRQLLSQLIAAAAEAGVWTIQSSIFPENQASLALHRSVGFRIVGTRRRIAEMKYGPWAGWRDTVLIERRAP